MIEIAVKKRLKTYDGTGSLQVNTSFATGAITTIYGPSGAGKTTFLKIMAGLVAPDEGVIRVNGETWLDTQAGLSLPPQMRKAGFVFQDYALFPTMTVAQHLAYGTADQSYIRQLVAIGQLEPFVNHKPAQLSGGQQQRLAILRALAPKPTVLLMDEPFSAMDAKLKTTVMEGLKTLITDSRITCLVVTHYPFETEGFAGHTYEFG